MIYDKLKFLLFKIGLRNWGICDISNISINEYKFPQALSVLFPYTYSIQNYDENQYYNLLVEKRIEIENKMSYVMDFLHRNKIEYCYIPYKDEKKNELEAHIFHKLYATQAGLGWIGKSSLLITKKHGPKVRLSSLFLNCDFPTNKPIIQSYCGNCKRCIEACPYSCISGTEWYPGIEREQLINFRLCNEKRKELVNSSGRKHSCGFCLLVCPWGE